MTFLKQNWKMAKIVNWLSYNWFKALVLLILFWLMLIINNIGKNGLEVNVGNRIIIECPPDSLFDLSTLPGLGSKRPSFCD